MSALIQIELFKLLKQRRTYIALIALGVIELFVLAVAYYQGKGILDSLLEGLRDSFVFQGELLNGNLVSYFILNSLWFHLPLIIMIITSGLITSEYQEGTIRVAYLHSASKTRFIVSKFIAATIFTVVVVGMLAVTAMGLSYLLFGPGDLVVYFDGLTFFRQEDAIGRLYMAFGAGTISMLFYSISSLTLGIIFRQTIKTWILAALLLVISNLLLQLDLTVLAIDQWFYIGQLDSWQRFFLRDISWAGLCRSLIVLLLYVLMIALFGIVYFRKKDIG